MLKTKTAKGMIFIPLDIGYGSLTERNATGKSNVPLPPQLKLIQAHCALILSAMAQQHNKSNNLDVGDIYQRLYLLTSKCTQSQVKFYRGNINNNVD